MRGCQKLQSVSARAGDRDDLSVEELRVIWAEDRVVAAQCHRRLNGLVKFYGDLRNDLLEPEE